MKDALEHTIARGRVRSFAQLPFARPTRDYPRHMRHSLFADRAIQIVIHRSVWLGRSNGDRPHNAVARDALESCRRVSSVVINEFHYLRSIHQLANSLVSEISDLSISNKGEALSQIGRA